MTTIDLSNESQRAARCFEDYRSMGKNRSLSGLLDYYLSNPNSSPVKTLQTLKRYSSRYSWQERVKQYEEALATEILDSEIEQRKKEFQERVLEFSRFHQQHGRLAFAAATRALDRIEAFLSKKQDCCPDLDSAVKLATIVRSLTPLSEMWAKAIGVDQLLSRMAENSEN